ncbi:hypothetical protein LC613_28690 [Nostoc sphaeroides CHAB 2801]|uniref:hypothetical protein n=1 Tax=Nostoc sphaeroides TaxID=446679 RepID=UPI001E64E990|nr:hypothetical protein [Nostoc sphaeroides]MCC5631698.1 hypothetical protein [Nostoc sphaeroides CHAB 2801]
MLIEVEAVVFVMSTIPEELTVPVKDGEARFAFKAKSEATVDESALPAISQC